MVFALRNALHDFAIDDKDGFIQVDTNDPDLNLELNGKLFMMHLSWIVWLANTAIMTIILLNLIISIMSQTYSAVTGNLRAHIY